MVSLGTWIKLGVVIAAVMAFYRLGGAAGIGGRVAGGFETLGSTLGGGLNVGLTSFSEGITSGFGNLGNAFGNLFQSAFAAPEIGSVVSVGGGGGAVQDEANVGQVIDSMGTHGNVVSNYHPDTALSASQRELLAFAGVLQHWGLDHQVDINTGRVYYQQGGYDDLPLNPDGTIMFAEPFTTDPVVLADHARMSAQDNVLTFNQYGHVTYAFGYPATAYGSYHTGQPIIVG